MIETSGHLPECNQRDTAWQKAYYSGVECVCPALRACEQRIMLLKYNEVKGWSAMKEAIAYNAGMDAAREAVADIEDEYVGDAYEQGRTALRVALAAIDALKEKP